MAQNSRFSMQGRCKIYPPNKHGTSRHLPVFLLLGAKIGVLGLNDPKVHFAKNYGRVEKNLTVKPAQATELQWDTFPKQPQLDELKTVRENVPRR
jgi:hypothetical protein